MDRNFDDLALQFSQRIYSGTKGSVRLAVLERDLQEVMGDRLAQPLRVLDAGGGEGQFSRKLAQAGHQITLCDHSRVMVDNARQAAQAEQLDQHYTFICDAIQRLPAPAHPYDLILCHAVLEWVQDWQGLLAILQGWLTPGGYLSLMFYNRHSTVFRSLVRGYFDRVSNDQVQGSGKGLTPLYPLEPDRVVGFLAEQGWQIDCQSGVRVFHDYMHKDIQSRRSAEDIIALEKRFSRQEPYRSLGRYYHVMARQAESS
ncbi:methyltransferase domain-containing protein [Ketobacter sp.]|uniref:methyltransferase domain-containing protein n=1 Tax=Ketobacter sp. TaxID=2083498 RepID=UPI000F1681CE|nr:methyltransferase domain-containing protein [Ketobacter sp.]RLT94426.1 MAG: methyltransferase domain-containing protein [Ketobacter sp.]